MAVLSIGFPPYCGCVLHSSSSCKRLLHEQKTYFAVTSSLGKKKNIKANFRPTIYITPTKPSGKSNCRAFSVSQDLKSQERRGIENEQKGT
jgi:hypothetical protein